ncbi:methylenetetrahydrofolate--tRNA-(uracil(54)-C(5))-methyltransferase (FADH(2)-oxidizing) TrmFO [Leptolyngbya sp. 15MV]|nr:methylenetetrahydrofolate--tRNA-(uracil(54)-C(5))-methyltransferase (FADH(2)-oxidizing) TrmFO [Leptolyngbya sp. 15MV]
MKHDVHIIGGGLAGSEAAWQLAEAGFRVRLSEMRGSGTTTPAHETDGLAELVCSNSFRSDDDAKNAVGLMHHEMRRLGSLVMRAGEVARVPAGSAMAVDRDVFSAEVEKALHGHPNVEVVRERIDTLPASGPTIVATGPLTAEALAKSIVAATGQDRLAFFDAIAPIVHRDSIDMDVCWIQSRWDKTTAASNEGGDYINCPMTREQYLAFHQGLLDGEKTEFKEWEADTPYFDGCMPIEVMAARGVDTLRFGPMKPVGLDNPRDTTPEFPQGRWPHAVVQLRQDNKLGTLWNMVGFQTKLIRALGHHLAADRRPGVQAQVRGRPRQPHRREARRPRERQLRREGPQHQVPAHRHVVHGPAGGRPVDLVSRAREVPGAAGEGAPVHRDQRGQRVDGDGGEVGAAVNAQSAAARQALNVRVPAMVLRGLVPVAPITASSPSPVARRRPSSSRPAGSSRCPSARLHILSSRAVVLIPGPPSGLGALRSERPRRGDRRRAPRAERSERDGARAMSLRARLVPLTSG